MLSMTFDISDNKYSLQSFTLKPSSLKWNIFQIWSYQSCKWVFILSIINWASPWLGLVLPFALLRMDYARRDAVSFSLLSLKVNSSEDIEWIDRWKRLYESHFTISRIKRFNAGIPVPVFTLKTEISTPVRSLYPCRLACWSARGGQSTRSYSTGGTSTSATPRTTTRPNAVFRKRAKWKPKRTEGLSSKRLNSILLDLASSPAGSMSIRSPSWAPRRMYLIRTISPLWSGCSRYRPRLETSSGTPAYMTSSPPGCESPQTDTSPGARSRWGSVRQQRRDHPPSRLVRYPRVRSLWDSV